MRHEFAKYVTLVGVASAGLISSLGTASSGTSGLASDFPRAAASGARQRTHAHFGAHLPRRADSVPALTISTAATSGVSCLGTAPIVCTATQPAAVLNSKFLQTSLNTSDVQINANGNQLEPGDIIISAPLTWSSASGLTLDADESITINKPVTDSGAAPVTLATDDGGTGGVLSFGTGAHIMFAGVSNVLTINGQAYTLVNSVTSLASAVANNDKGSYALAANYNATNDGTYTAAPVTELSGTIEGLGNTITGLKISGSTNSRVGLIGTNGGVVRDIGLVGGSVSGGPGAIVGALAGQNYGTIAYSYATGGVSGKGGAVIGGLVGGNLAIVDHSYARGHVSGTTANVVGGLVGTLVAVPGAAITNSHATGSVIDTGLGIEVGGLVGSAEDATITNCYATGSVTAKTPSGGYGAHSWAGGLAGIVYGNGVIQAVFATGNVVASVQVNAVGAAGGLLGVLGSGSTLSNAYATGSATATGSGNSTAAAGGLIGYLYDDSTPVDATYSTGAVSATATCGVNCEYAGGFAGIGSGNPTTNSYWDTDTSGTSFGCGDGSCSGVTGLTTVQLKDPSLTYVVGFDSGTWTIGTLNGGFPYLIANPPPK
jgi:hypothetical protein